MTIYTCGRHVSLLISHLPLIINLRVWKDHSAHLLRIYYTCACMTPGPYFCFRALAACWWWWFCASVGIYVLQIFNPGLSR